MNIPKAISLNEQLWAKIDKERGDVSRSRFISKMLHEHFNLLKGGLKK